tara:strand:+ start:1392 stop:1931 length:540 start_codon:yes stop_codon:yes gene_type:complete
MNPIAAINAAPDSPEKKRVLEVCQHDLDILDRRSRPGHLTASALVIDPVNRNILLLYHKKLKKWLQPGGHADGDGDLARVALREATEETGIVGLLLVEPPIDLDVHKVSPPNEDSHQHYDLRYLILAPSKADPVGNSESEKLRWVSVSDFSDMQADTSLYRLANRGLRVLADISINGLI